MRVCVTGGAGFIGSHLVDRLLADGHEVVVLDDLSTGKRENLGDAGGRVTFLEADIRRPGDVAQALQGCEVVFHQAALASVPRSVADPRLVADVNIGGTFNVLMAAREAGVRRVVAASSSSVYGGGATLPKTESMPLQARSPYAATKVALEALLSGFHGSFGLETVALRYFNVFGPRQSGLSGYAAVIPSWMEALRNGRPVVVHGDGRQTRDFTHVSDVVEANVRAATAPGAVGRAINIGGGRRVSLLELLAVIAQEVGVAVEPQHSPARAGDVRDSLADIGLARALLGWAPQVSLEGGIRDLARSRAGAGR